MSGSEAPAASGSPGMRERIGGVVERTYAAWRDDRTIRLGAGLAYYGLFAIVPVLAITAAVAELIFGTADIASYVGERASALGIENADNVADSLAEEISGQAAQVPLGGIGLVSLLFASSLVFVALNDAINVIWDVPVESGFGHTIRRRLVAFAMVLATGVFLILDFATSALTGAAEKLIPGDVATVEDVAGLTSSFASGLVLAVAITMLFRYLSPVTVPWRSAITAAVLTAVLMVVSSAAFGWYLREYGGASLAGAFGAAFAVLTWVYAQGQILLVGVQLSKELSRSADAGVVGDQA